MRKILLEHLHRYPNMQIQDMVKLIYQNEFAGSHMLPAQDSLPSIEQEYRNVKSGSKLVSPRFEKIGNGLCRLHLSGIESLGIRIETLGRFFVSTARSVSGNRRRFEDKLGILRECCRDGTLPFNPARLDQFLDAYRLEGCPPVHHSEIFRKSYQPSYRVVSLDFERYLSMFQKIEGLLGEKNLVTVGIDGRCTSGKSTLAELIGSVYDCNIFHMDDFFLQPEQRTAQRLAEAGGNVDYERFNLEVMYRISQGQTFRYTPYDCSIMGLGQPVFVNPKQLNIVEGSYSMRPELIDRYDLKIFLDIDPAKQHSRILKRNGQSMYKRFIDEWIPMEEDYFKQMNIAGQCDLQFRA